MRDWLDAHQIEPLLFQLNGTVLSLGLANAGEATAFADAFDGRVLSETDARCLAAFCFGAGQRLKHLRRGWMPR